MTIKGVDLLPTEKKSITLDPLIFILVILIICSVGVFWFIGKQYEKQIANYKTKIADIEAQIKDISSKIPEIDTVKREIASLKEQIRVIEEKRNNPKVFKNVLKEIAKITPVNTYLTRLDIEPSSSKISLSGVSVLEPGIDPLNSIANYIRNFQSSGIFQNVNMGSASQSKAEGAVTYTFSMDVNFLKDKAAEIDTGKILNTGGAGR